MSPHTHPDPFAACGEFDIEPIHVSHRRANKWYAIVSHTETGRRFLTTDYCGSAQTACEAARRLIAAAQEKQRHTAEAGR